MTFISLLAGLLSFSLAIFGAGALLALALLRFAGARGRDLDFNLAYALCSAFAVLLLLNLNAWVPGQFLYWAAGLAGAGCAIAFFVLCSTRSQRIVGLGAMCASMVVCGVLLSGWYWMFAGNHFWMLEGTNHDMVFFYGGAKWAATQPLLAEQPAIAAAWGLGDCSAGMHVIGTGCALYRGGTYTLLAMGTAFDAGAGPNAVRAAVGLLGVFPVLGFIAVGRAEESNRAQAVARWALLTGLSLLVAVSAGILCSVSNENIGTAIAGGVLAAVAIWVLLPSSSPAFKAMLLGIGAAIAGHVYGEAAVYACWLVMLGVLTDAWNRRQPTWILQGGAISFACFAIGLNFLIPELYRSYTVVNGLVVARDWASWYIHAAPFTWAAAPFAGLLMGGTPPVTPTGLIVGMFLTALTLYMGIKRGHWIACVGLLIVSWAMAFFVESHGYQYGEHKIVELIAPIWSAFLCTFLYQDIANKRQLSWTAWTKLLAVASVLLLLSVSFLYRTKEILNGHTQYALDYRFEHLLPVVKPGDEVVIDISGVHDAARYIKQDLVVLEIHRQGARTRFSRKTDDSMIAYSDALTSGSFISSKSPDWLIQFRSGAVSSVIQGPEGARSNDEISVYDLRNGALPVALAGEGWYRCEPGHCWTGESFGVETYVPLGCPKGGQLMIEEDFFNPPANATVEVIVNDRSLGHIPLAEARQLRVNVPSATSKISVRPGWEVKSPSDLGQSADGRKLFATIQRVSLICR